MAKNSQLLLDIGQGLSLMVGLPKIAAWDTKTRPASPKRGMIGFNQETLSLEYYDGYYWYEAAMTKS